MEIGKYKLGRYHAVIEKRWEDNTYTYETNFISEADLQESISAIMYCISIGAKCGMDKPMKIIDVNTYKGNDAINKLKSLIDIQEQKSEK